MPSTRTQFARTLRRNETDAEKLLWRELRGRNLNGFKFVRQYPIGPYIADFACREKALVVELDGAQHAENMKYLERTGYINRAGFSVIRFWNEEVLRERDDARNHSRHSRRPPDGSLRRHTFLTRHGARPMKSTQKPPLRSRGFIGARPASSVTADTAPQKFSGPAKSRGAVKPNPTGAPKGLEDNIPPRPKWRIK